MLFLVGGCAFLTRLVTLSDLADDRFPDPAAVAELTLVVVGFFANGVDFGSVGWLVAILSKQPCEEHSWKLACDGASKPQPTKIPATTPMRSSPMQFPSSGAEFRSHSCCDLILLLMLYLLRKSVKRSLSVHPL
jgi:hypothetical protein